MGRPPRGKSRFDGPSLKAVIVQGLPSGIQNSVISLANVIVQSNINSFGANAMAGCGAYSKVEGFAFLPVTCFAMALATFVSQNVGAGQPDRVRKGMKFGILCSIAMAEVVGVCHLLWRPPGSSEPSAASRTSSLSASSRPTRRRCSTACWRSAIAVQASCAAWAARWCP